MKKQCWCIFYASEFTVHHSVAPCLVLYRKGEHLRAIVGSERRWLLPSHVFDSRQQAEAAAREARGVNAWS